MVENFPEFGGAAKSLPGDFFVLSRGQLEGSHGCFD
jgi:hypothetical protein